MKKIIFVLIFAMAGLLFAGMQSVNAQDDVDYWVSFDWNDNSCSCNEPVTKYVKFEVYTYPGGLFVDDSGWEEATGTSCIIYENGPIRTDCHSDCYTVFAYVKYVDNSGICCEGDASETCTGQQLVDGYPFENTIIMN